MSLARRSSNEEIDPSDSVRKGLLCIRKWRAETPVQQSLNWFCAGNRSRKVSLVDTCRRKVDVHSKQRFHAHSESARSLPDAERHNPAATEQVNNSDRRSIARCDWPLT